MVAWTRVKQLGLMAMKTFADTIANGLKKDAGCPPKFRRFAINLAQANHRLTTRMESRLYDHTTDVPIRPLNEEKAAEAAGLLLAELSVYAAVGAAALIFEVQRRKKNKKALEDEQLCPELQAIKTEFAGELELQATKRLEIDALKRIEFHAQKQVELAQKQLETARKQVELAQKDVGSAQNDVGLAQKLEEVIRNEEMLEEVNLNLRKLEEADGSIVSFPEELAQLLQEHEENDDASTPSTKADRLKTELHPHIVSGINYPSFHEVSFSHQL